MAGRPRRADATVGADGPPHVAVGWTHNRELDTIDVGGHSPDTTNKFSDVARTARAAIVIDDLLSVDPWRPRAIACPIGSLARGEDASNVVTPSPVPEAQTL